MRRALITGVTGQDGSYCAEQLIKEGWEVWGLVRRSSVDNTQRIRSLDVRRVNGDVLDAASVRRALELSRPEAVYHYADQDNVDFSLDAPRTAVDVTYGGAVNVLEATRRAGSPRVLVPLSATVLDGRSWPQDERTPMRPQSPYACAKAAVRHLCEYYRSLGLHVVSPIMYNHDSPRRGPGYLLHKMARRALAIAAGREERMEMFDPECPVDIGHAKEHVLAQLHLMELPKPTEYVVATGVGCSIMDLWRAACAAAGLKDAESYAAATQQHRPGEEPRYVGDPGYCKAATGWRATKTGLDVTKELVEHYRCA